MKTLTQYREDVAALVRKDGDIDAKAIAENRDPSDAELELKNDIYNEIDRIKTIIQAMERKEALGVGGGEAKPLTIENSGSRSPITGTDNRSKDRFLSFGEQLASVMRAGCPGGSADPRLFNAAATGLNETTPSDGGFLVQKDFAQELLEDVFQTGILSSKVGRRIPISGNANGTVINGVDETSRAASRYGGVVAYWASEAEEKTKSKPKFRRIELNLKKLIGLCYATDESLDDSAQLENVIRKSFVGEFGFQIDDAIINGTGAGKPLGILKGGSLVSVGKETGQAKDTIMAENVIKMYSRLLPASYANAEWYINQDTLPSLLTMSVAVGTGGFPVYLPPGNSLSNAPGGTLLGRPVNIIEQAATLGDQGDIILADFSNGYVLAEKNGIKTDTSIHVRFIYDESAFRFVLRVDGQPVRASALTPYKGTGTLSHFVVLDAR